MSRACWREMSVNPSNSPLMLTEKELYQGQGWGQILVACSIMWRSFSTWIPWGCHLNWLQELLQFIAPLSSYFTQSIKHKLKLSRKTKGKRWERKMASKSPPPPPRGLGFFLGPGRFKEGSSLWQAFLPQVSWLFFPTSEAPGQDGRR